MSDAMPTVRRAGLDDEPLLLELIRRFYAVDGHDFDQARIAAALVPLLTGDQHGQVWVADIAGEPMGYAVVTWSWSLESGGRDCMLDELYVERRGDGTGGALLEAALAAAAKFGAAAVFLETEAPNDAARRFYARHDFAAEDSIWMSRPLS
jgi:GNAT superfamily N-acetyltransferase